ncbi:Protein DEHYDRATION-INDUCED 19 [Euphorbia peplus]|nr:Protein DEHYDRATION-INDUCED 19 [Euphorbia peplus]
MDSDFWTSRLAAAKRQYNLQNHHQSSHLDRLSIDEFEVEDDVRPDFPCPYCYEDFDIASLCSHLEDEHSCESKVTVCPICSVKVSRDMLSHITLQHGHLFKISLKTETSNRRRRLRRVAIPNSQALSLLGRDLREAHLQMLLGGSGYRNFEISNYKRTRHSYENYSSHIYVEIKFGSIVEPRRKGEKDEAGNGKSWFHAGSASLDSIKRVMKAVS